MKNIGFDAVCAFLGFLIGGAIGFFTIGYSIYFAIVGGFLGLIAGEIIEVKRSNR